MCLNSSLMFERDAFEPVIVTTGPAGHLAAVARAAGLRVEQIGGASAEAVYRQLLDELRPGLAISHFSDAGYALFAEVRNPEHHVHPQCLRVPTRSRKGEAATGRPVCQPLRFRLAQGD